MILRTFIFFILTCIGFNAHAAIDSLGIKTKDGKSYILHQLDPGETLFSLSKRYKVTVDEIMDSNEAVVDGLKIDQLGRILYIPLNKTVFQIDREKQAKTHKVQPSETLYSISKAYDVSTDELKEWNKLSSSDIFIGQELIIESPIDSSTNESQTDQENFKQSAENSTAGQVNKVAEEAKIHIVEAGQTLSAISRIYGVSIASIKEWNGLTSDQLALGQKLRIGQMNKTEKVNDEMNEVAVTRTIADEKEKAEETVPNGNLLTKENKEKIESRPGFRPIDLPEKDTKKIFESNPRANGSEIKKVTQKGVAEVINSSASSDKYLALHRTAKIGTILYIKNELNGQMVFVRVLGKLPDTGVDDNVVVRISKSAFDKLGGIDSRFPVEISYVP